MFIGIALALDFYALQSFRSVTKNPWVTIAYTVCSLGVLGIIVYQSLNFNRASGLSAGFYNAFALFVLFYVPKFVLVVTMFGEDIFRIFEGFTIVLRQIEIQAVQFLAAVESLLDSWHWGWPPFPFCRFYMA